MFPQAFKKTWCLLLTCSSTQDHREMSFTKKEKNIISCVYFTSIVLQIEKKKKEKLYYF